MAHKRRDYKKKMSETTLIIIKEEKRPTKGAKKKIVEVRKFVFNTKRKGKII